MRAKEAVSHMSKSTVSGASTNKEQTPSSVQTVYLRTNSNSQHIITQAQTEYISFCSLTVCHYGNGVLEPGHSTSPMDSLPSYPKKSHRHLSLWQDFIKIHTGKGEQLSTHLYRTPTDHRCQQGSNWQQQTLADSPPSFVQQLPEGAGNAVKTTIPVLAEKPGKDKPQAGGWLFSNPATHQSLSLW